jgi:hypothetical protein
MDTLHDRLAELAHDAPRGGAPAAELWARGKRAPRRRAIALAATCLVVGAVGTGIGVGLADGDRDRSVPAPAGTAGIALPIEYPVGEELPALGDTPGPLAAIWLTPRVGGGPQVVGLVAESGAFGTLPIDLSSTHYDTPDPYVALSTDGRRIAYQTATDELVVRDLESGANFSPAFEFQIRAGYTWVDATHLVGHVAGMSDTDGWVWEPGTAPKLVDLRAYPGSPWLGPQAGVEPWFLILPQDGDPQSCLSLQDLGAGRQRPVLCDVVGVIGPEIALTHDGSGSVVALDIDGVEDPLLRRVVARPGAPQRVTFATELIGEALDAVGGAS